MSIPKSLQHAQFSGALASPNVCHQKISMPPVQGQVVAFTFEKWAQRAAELAATILEQDFPDSCLAQATKPLSVEAPKDLVEQSKLKKGQQLYVPRLTLLLLEGEDGENCGSLVIDPAGNPVGVITDDGRLVTPTRAGLTP